MQQTIRADGAAIPDAGAVLIIGGGMAGSLLALVLGRAGRDVVVFDPKRTPAPTFRNEKLGGAQIELLRKLDALSCFEAACWPPQGHPDAYPEDARPGLTDCGAPHQAWLSQVRASWPANVRFVEAMVERIETSDDIQSVTTSRGERFDGRLVVLATGRLSRLRDALGIEQRTISAGHSVCLGFSVKPGRPIPAQVLTAPRGSGLGYVSIFPMPGELRVNVFSYRGLDDGWTRRMAADPLTALAELAPEAAAVLDGCRVVRRCEARGTDLYEVGGHVRAGVVLIGDAFHAPCPASGTGMLRILNDVDILAREHLPRWLATPGMDRDKIAGFYVDTAKRRLDDASLRTSLRGRGAAVGTDPYWRTRRAVAAVAARWAGASAGKALLASVVARRGWSHASLTY